MPDPAPPFGTGQPQRVTKIGINIRGALAVLLALFVGVTLYNVFDAPRWVLAYVLPPAIALVVGGYAYAAGFRAGERHFLAHFAPAVEALSRLADALLRVVTRTLPVEPHNPPTAPLVSPPGSEPPGLVNDPRRREGFG